MKNFILRILLPILLIFTISSCSPDPLESVSVVIPADKPKIEVKYDYSESEFAMARLINDYRISMGLNELELSDYVSIKAQEHNLYMIQNNDVSHAQFKERSDDIIRVLGAKTVNENIAYNYATLESALNAWIRSPGHRANLEGKFTNFGISIVVNQVNGKKYYTIIFIKI